MKHYLVASSALLAGSACIAGIVAVDGTAEELYGPAIVTQAIGTGFGDANLGLRGDCNGSELDGAFGHVDAGGGFLYLTFAGNLASNYNKLEVFIDCRVGQGQNMLRNDNPDVDFNNLNAMGADPVAGIPGLRFDAGFDADFYMTSTGGGTPYTLYTNFAELLTNGGGNGAYIGSANEDPSTGIILLNDAVNNIQVSIDNRNVVGVDGSNGGASSGAGVRSGVEMRIPLSLMGWDGTSPIKVCAFVNGLSHDYASNQFLSPLPAGRTNLGGDGNGNWIGSGAKPWIRFDLGTIAGDQFFVVPVSAGNTCPADLDHDDTVSGSDLSALLGSWGPCSGTCAADLDHDGVVAGSDLSQLLGSWGPCP